MNRYICHLFLTLTTITSVVSKCNSGTATENLRAVLIGRCTDYQDIANSLAFCHSRYVCFHLTISLFFLFVDPFVFNIPFLIMNFRSKYITSFISNTVYKYLREILHLL